MNVSTSSREVFDEHVLIGFPRLDEPGFDAASLQHSVKATELSTGPLSRRRARGLACSSLSCSIRSAHAD